MKTCLILLASVGLLILTACGGDDMKEVTQAWDTITLDELKAEYSQDVKTENLNVDRQLKEERKDFNIFEVNFDGVNEQRVVGLLGVPKSEVREGPYPVIYYFPRARESKEEISNIAEFVAREGWAVFATDKPRAPVQKDSAIVSDILNAAVVQQATVKNGHRGILALSTFEDIAEDRMICMGGSFGTTSTIILSALEPGIQMGVTIVGSVGGMEEQAFRIYRPIYRENLRERLLTIKASEPAFFLDLLENKPVLLINAKYDQNIKNVLVEKLHNGIKGPKKIMMVDRDHVFPIKIVMPDIIQWIKENLKPEEAATPAS